MTVGLVTFLLFSISEQALSQSIQADKFVEIGGHKVRYQTEGTGAATVVFESGLGNGLNAWDNIYPEVAKFAKVFRYDREGYGLSEKLDPNSRPKSFKEIATRLHELLQKAGINPPYIFTGHSLGGPMIRAFNFLYPNEVAGFVFVDPTSEFHIGDRTQNEMKHVVDSLDAMASRFPLKVQEEWGIMRLELLNGFPETKTFGPIPNVPTVVLAAGITDVPNSSRNFYLNKVSKLSDGYLIEIAQSSHYIQNYEPSIVIESIKRVVGKSISKSKSGNKK